MSTSSNKGNEEVDRIPEHVLKVKEKLEKETGKKYRYRPAKKDLPSVGELLKSSSVKPPTLKESVFNAVILAFIFAMSLFAYHHFVLSRPSKRTPYKLPQQKRLEAAKQQQQKSRNQAGPGQDVPIKLTEATSEDTTDL